MSPLVGRSDLYYGGTTYENDQGLGVQLPLARCQGNGVRFDHRQPVAGLTEGQLLVVPVTRLYDRGALVTAI